MTVTPICPIAMISFKIISTPTVTTIPDLNMDDIHDLLGFTPLIGAELELKLAVRFSLMVMKNQLKASPTLNPTQLVTHLCAQISGSKQEVHFQKLLGSNWQKKLHGAKDALLAFDKLESTAIILGVYGMSKVIYRICPPLGNGLRATLKQLLKLYIRRKT